LTLPEPRRNLSAMNGKIKFHKANGPAFNPGEKWQGASCQKDNYSCEIISVRQYGEGKWDYQVTYKFKDGVVCTKDAWSFQVRYQHVADKYI